MFSWVQLQHLVDWTTGRVEGEANLSLPIRTISSDSRHIGKGDVFVALKGDNFDGHDYLEQAVEKGASVIISEKPAKLKVPVVVVSNTFMAMMQIGSALRKAFQGPVIAVTGSAGKSSTRDMIATLLGPGTTKSPKSYNNLLGVSKTLFLIEDSTKYLVLEMGMNALGELETICDHFHPVAGLITNVGDAHVGRMGGQDKIYQAKKEVFDHLAEFPNETLGIVVNGDDPLVRKAADEAFSFKVKRLEFSSEDSTADLFISKREIHSKTGSLLVEVREGADSVSVTLPHFGLHQGHNFAAAVGMARLLGISWQDIRERSRKILVSDHRGELINLKNGVTLIDESYNSNPSALKSALSSAMQLDPKRRHVLVLGAMRELEPYHEKYHREVGEALATMLESAPISTVVVGVGGDTSHLLEPIRQRLPKVPTHLLVSVEEAIKIVPNLLEPGDILLLKGSRGIELDRLVQVLKGNA